MAQTIAQIYAQVKSDLESQMQSQIPVIGKSMLRVFAMVQAGKIWLLYLAVELVQKNIFIDTADPESMGGTLERFGRVKLNRNPFPATAGQYEVEVTGSIGATIPASQTFKSNDDSNSPGFLFVLDNAFTLTSTTDTITLRALDAGLDAKLVVGDRLTSTAPIALVDSQVEVTAETIEPKSAETIEDYRRAGILAYQLEPQGGAGGDYTIWANDAQGVRTVYPYAKSGVFGEIDLFVEATLVDSIDGNGTPSQQLLDDVEEVIERDPDTTKPLNERGRRPISAWQINYLPVTPLPIVINITGYVNATPSVQTLIQNGITDALFQIRPFVASRDVLANKNDFIDLNKLIFIIQTSVPQSVFTSVDMTVNGVPQISFTFFQGNIPYLAQINYL
jgi:hypothetical protein